jgi:hypothetical protein
MSILFCWALNSIRIYSLNRYKHFERWATASDFPVENIINDGTTLYKTRMGTVRDLELVLRTKSITDDIFVIAGDMLFQVWAKPNSAQLPKRCIPVLGNSVQGFSSADSELGIFSKLGHFRFNDSIHTFIYIYISFRLTQDHNFDIAQVLNYFKLKRDEGDLAIYYEMHPSEDVLSRGIVDVCHKTNKLVFSSSSYYLVLV